MPLSFPVCDEEESDLIPAFRTMTPVRWNAMASASASVGLCDHIFEIDSQVDDGLGDLRANPADDTVGSHESSRRDGLEEVLGNQGIDDRHACNIDDGDG